MTAPVWLIAGREFRTYVATWSFWVALVVGPVASGAAFALMAAAPPTAPSQSLVLTAEAGGGLSAHFSRGFPLSAVGRGELLELLRRDGRLRQPVRQAPSPSPVDPGAASRFVLALMLWTTLTGSLGMLLQSIVRERQNRALESLLAAASRIDVVLGKLLGVGAVSGLVMLAWLASSAALALAAPSSSAADGLLRLLVKGLDQPALLLRAIGLYGAAYAFYGLTTIAIGVRARDDADAQNLARPMFAVLLMVFFATIASISTVGRALRWLSYLPPFTPFMLLIRPQPLGSELAALVLTAVAAVAAGGLAVRGLNIGFGGASISRAGPPGKAKS